MQPTSMVPDTVPYIVLERRDPTANMARYYVLSLEPRLIRRHRPGAPVGPARSRRPANASTSFGNAPTRLKTLEAWFARKRRRGYVAR